MALKDKLRKGIEYLAIAAIAASPAYAKKDQEPKQTAAEQTAAQQTITQQTTTQQTTTEKWQGIDYSKNIAQILLETEKADPITQEILKNMIEEAQPENKATYTRGETEAIVKTIYSAIEKYGKSLDMMHKAIAFKAIAENTGIPIYLINTPTGLLAQWDRTRIKTSEKDNINQNLKDLSPVQTMIDPTTGKIIKDQQPDNCYWRKLNRDEEISIIKNYTIRQTARKGNESIYQTRVKGQTDPTAGDQYFKELIQDKNIDDYEKAARIYPHPDAYNNLVFLLIKKAQLENRPEILKKALQECDKGLNIDPEYKPLNINKRYILKKMQK